MFSFLKKKIKDAVSSLSKKAEEVAKKEEVEVTSESPITQPIQEPPKKRSKNNESKIPPSVNGQEESKLFQDTKVEVSGQEQGEQEKQGKSKEGFFKRLFSKKEGAERPKEAQDPLDKLLPRSEAELTIQDVPAPKMIAPSEEIKVTLEEKKVVKQEGEDKESDQSPIEEKKGFFSRIAQKITTTTISIDQFDSLFWDLELALLENNVAVEVIEKLKKDLEHNLVDKPLARGRVEEEITSSLKTSLEGLFQTPAIDLFSLINNKNGPFVICFVGVNGSGKTTTIAKIAKLIQDKGLSVVLAACDTFRAAAIDQLQMHADRLGVKLVKHDYGADPAAVAFDALAHAKKAGRKVVLIDTAGRLHSNTNLMEELQKIVRVAKPDLKIFIGESVTGNDCVIQAQKFDEAVGIDGIVLAKADADEKGGAAISVSFVTGKPILYLGTGQAYTDLEPFDAQKIMARLGI